MMQTLKQLTTTATTAVKVWRKATSDAVSAQRKLGDAIAPVSDNRKSFFGGEKAKEYNAAFVSWYLALGLTKEEVSHAVSRAMAYDVLGATVESTLNTAHIQRLAPVLKEKASGSSRMIPKKERKANAVKVLAQAKKVAKADRGRDMSGTDIVNARDTLGIRPAKVREEGSKDLAKAKALVSAFAAMTESATSLFAEDAENVATAQAFAANVQAFHENAAQEIDEEEVA
jgi:hypothetical protein